MKLNVLITFFLVLMIKTPVFSAGTMLNVHQNINMENASIVSTQSSDLNSGKSYNIRKEKHKKSIGHIENNGGYISGGVQNINLKNAKIIISND